MKPAKFSLTPLLSLVIGLLALLVAACGGGSGVPATGTSGSTTKADPSKQVLVRPFAGLADLKTIDPALLTDLYSAQAVNMVFSGLIELDDKGNITPALAESYKVGDDGITWTFTLRDGLKFSDGTDLTSQDVVYSIDRALQPATKSTYGPYYLSLIKDSDKLSTGKIKTLIGDSLMAPDPKTVIIKANKKAAYFLYTISYQVAYVVEKKLIDKYGAKFTDHLGEGGGSGPWIVSNYTRGKEIDFTPNPNYYGAKPQLRKVARPFYQVSDTTYRAYQTNQLDRATVPLAQLSEAKALPNGQYHQDPALAISYYTMNYLVKPFDNIHIRQAFALAINKDLIANNIYKGTVIPTNHIIPEGMIGYNPDLTGPAGVKDTKGNQALAKQLFEQGLQEEGLTRATFPAVVFTGSSTGSADVRNEFAAIQQMFNTTLGVNVKFEDIDFNKLLSDTTATTNNPKGLMAYGLAWIADYPDPQDWTSIQFGNGAGNNNQNYGQNQGSTAAQQQQVQKLLEQADVNQDATERIKQYQQAEQQLINDVAWIPTYQQTVAYVQKPCVVGFINNAFDITPPDSWAQMYKSTDSNCADVSRYQ